MTPGFSPWFREDHGGIVVEVEHRCDVACVEGCVQEFDGMFRACGEHAYLDAVSSEAEEDEVAQG